MCSDGIHTKQLILLEAPAYQGFVGCTSIAVVVPSQVWIIWTNHGWFDIWEQIRMIKVKDKEISVTLILGWIGYRIINMRQHQEQKQKIKPSWKNIRKNSKCALVQVGFACLKYQLTSKVAVSLARSQAVVTFTSLTLPLLSVTCSG